MPKIDYKKDYKNLYFPKNIPALIDVPPMSFIMIDVKGDPKEKEYQDAVSLLFSLSYTIKTKGKDFPGYFDYTVFPLEGLWWTENGDFDFNRRDLWRTTCMIRQPEFVTLDIFSWAVDIVKKKRSELDFSKARFEIFSEGLCVQAMHTGPYANEPETIEKIGAFIAQNRLCGLENVSGMHHEIYLSDPNKTKPEKINTVIRYQVKTK